MDRSELGDAWAKQSISFAVIATKMLSIDRTEEQFPGRTLPTWAKRFLPTSSIVGGTTPLGLSPSKEKCTAKRAWVRFETRLIMGYLSMCVKFDGVNIHIRSR